MSERDIVELLVRWRSLAMMLEREEFKRIAGDQKGLIAAILMILLELQQSKSGGY
ncbi:MAG: hypothetical protein KAS63_06160 [Candidatus Heimdallarchaeota archaeon]|nr:hypothetical protein [Candidatus Heimdallarchaeota archaeon]MCK4954925.1 hypothetical protein [Candidatus Heimdallarchaeota archaeon]